MSTRPIKAVLLDWAGTTVDYGSRAPTQVFVEIFRRRGVEITIAEARGPMGRAKHEHIAMVAALPRVTELWRQRHGAAPTDVDVRAMYDDFLPLQKEILKQGSNVIPGIPEAIAELRQRGIRIGSSTAIREHSWRSSFLSQRQAAITLTWWSVPMKSRQGVRHHG